MCINQCLILKLSGNVRFFIIFFQMRMNVRQTQIVVQRISIVLILTDLMSVKVCLTSPSFCITLMMQSSPELCLLSEYLYIQHNIWLYNVLQSIQDVHKNCGL